MTQFLIFAALLIGAAVLIMALPLLRRAARPADLAAQAAGRRAANLAILRDQLAELDNERKEGTLSDTDFAQAKDELQRRLLEETEAGEPALAATASGRNSALFLLLALPIAAAAGYAILGEPRALDPTMTQSASRAGEQQLQGLIDQLAERLKQNPDDVEGWVTLARTYKTLGRFTEAAAAYARGGRLLDENTQLLTDYAETLAQIAGGSLLGRPQELIAKALSIDPDDPQALLLAGAAASEQGKFAAAADYWERLGKQMDPDSEEGRTVAGAVARARAAAAGHEPTQDAAQPAAANRSVSGEVSVAPALAARVKPDDVVFVFARAEDGERRPLAALKGSAAELPLKFSLDDAAALPGGRKLSEVDKVTIEARVAKSGAAQKASGDLYGRLAGVKTGSKQLVLVIDQVEP